MGKGRQRVKEDLVLIKEWQALENKVARLERDSVLITICTSSRFTLPYLITLLAQSSVLSCSPRNVTLIISCHS